jgi:tetratricopeptide (TPR) repeat protein
MIRCSAPGILITCAIVCAAGAAHGQATSSAAATAQFDKGRTLFKAGKYAEACAAFEQSQKIEAAFGTLYNLAGCYVKIGKLASAWVAYRELAQRDTRATRKADSAKRARELEPRLARLLIAVSVAGARGSPDGLVVTMNGEDVTALVGAENPVDTGRYQIVATAPQFKERATSVEVVAEGKTVTAALELERAPREVPPPAPPVVAQVAPAQPAVDDAKPERDAAPAPASHRRLYGAIAGGAGLALVATSLVFGSLASGKWSDVKKLCGDDATCEPDQAAEARRLDNAARTDANIATGLAIGGAVAIGVGAYLWLTAPSGASRTALQLRPGAGSTSAGLTLAGRF